MQYEEALSYIKSTNKFGEKNGLEGIKRLCERLGNPQKDMKFIHVAGTNGKGSTCTYVASVLKEAGYKTGLFTSPFIYEFNERFKINGENISDDELAKIMTEVKKEIDCLIEEGFPNPTEFEVITAVAFLYYYRKKCDIVVLEVGLGGRFDSTNIIENPVCCAICSIGFDHMQYLGDNLSDIAFEKCGIIKERCPVVNYPRQKEEANRVIEKIAAERNACLLECDDILIKESGEDGSVFDACGIENIKTPLLGEHQIYNASVAVRVLLELKTAGFNIDDDMIKRGIEKSKWPARLEKLSENPCLIFDGAHNIDGMQSFVKSAEAIANGRRVIIVLGMVSDKECSKCIAELDGLADVLITTTLETPRTEKAENLMKAAEFINCEKYITKNVDEAIEKAFAIADGDAVIFAVGSLYMAGEVKMKIKKKRE